MSVCVLGSINLDIVCRVAELPAPGETVAARDMHQYAGGKGANQAVASARWGAPTMLIGAVGRDDAAEFLIAHLEEAGVATSAIARLEGWPTGRAHINVSNAGENMIVVVGGANLGVDAAQTQAADLQGATVVIAQLETPIAAIEILFARKAGTAIRILNAAPAENSATALFSLADILVVNQTELKRYAGATASIYEPVQLDRAARTLISRAGQTVIVTLGAAGARIISATAARSAAGARAAVVDTTGAGDCFCGVLAAALSTRRTIADAVGIANVAAAVSTEHPGAAVPFDLRQRVVRHLTA
jgi:ribokinase